LTGIASAKVPWQFGIHSDWRSVCTGISKAIGTHLTKLSNCQSLRGAEEDVAAFDQTVQLHAVGVGLNYAALGATL